MFFFHK